MLPIDIKLLEEIQGDCSDDEQKAFLRMINVPQTLIVAYLAVKLHSRLISGGGAQRTMRAISRIDQLIQVADLFSEGELNLLLEARRISNIGLTDAEVCLVIEERNGRRYQVSYRDRSAVIGRKQLLILRELSVLYPLLLSYESAIELWPNSKDHKAAFRVTTHLIRDVLTELNCPVTVVSRKGSGWALNGRMTFDWRTEDSPCEPVPS